MTRAEYLSLKPGQAIRQRRGARRVRIVLVPPVTHRANGRPVLYGIGLLKIGHSWTDPNPVASYDAVQIMPHYEIAGRGMPQWWVRKALTDDEARRVRKLRRRLAA
jgi:hypothetical protein